MNTEMVLLGTILLQQGSIIWDRVKITCSAYCIFIIMPRRVTQCNSEASGFGYTGWVITENHQSYFFEKRASPISFTVWQSFRSESGGYSNSVASTSPPVIQHSAPVCAPHSLCNNTVICGSLCSSWCLILWKLICIREGKIAEKFCMI